MQKLFNKILVPVDFTVRTKTAVERAVDIAVQYDCSIHLLHVTKTSAFPMVSIVDFYASYSFYSVRVRHEIEYQMGKIHDQINVMSACSLTADHTIMEGTWDECIIDYVNKNNVDLVLIGQKPKLLTKRKMLLNPDKIASKTDIAVITVPANRRLTRLYSIVIPITDFLPLRKLTYAAYIASKFNSTVKLLGIQNPSSSEKTQQYLQKAYELMVETCHVNVEREITDSENVADAIDRFSRSHSTDLVIVNPVTQTKMPGFFSSFFGNIIQKYSLPPVLTINAGFRIV